VAALQSGQPAVARAIFEQLLASGPADSALMTALALAHRALGESTRAMRVVEAVLAADPEHIRALLLKGALLAEAGDKPAATAFFSRALHLAGDGEGAPPEIREELRRARSYCDERNRSLAAALERSMAAAGLASARAGERFNEAVDILFGRRQRFVQEPRYFYFPGLPSIPFMERAAFPFLDALERESEAIRTELAALIADPAAFEPYVKADPARPANAQAGMAGNPDWSAHYLWKDGVPQAENLARCPRTAAAIERLPLCRMPNRSPSVLFSRLAPGAHIPAHNGLVNTRLIGHLPLIVPRGCRFRVGNHTREWVEGRAWLFDDSIEHEAWNDSNEERVILLFEVWRPELSEEERRAVCALFEAIDLESGRVAAWDV
jgi:aspartyl/asparaginyl beta-hydroxylase (cupin superfamily)